MTEFIICLPTYNEKENLETLIPELLDIFNEHNLDGNILVIDDNSPDRTAEVARTWNKKDSRVQLLFRNQKEGLGKAYVAGFKEALKLNPKYIFEMDADHSHNPKIIPDMLLKLKNENCTLVVGSRKIEGGATENWGIHRQIVSSGANFYTRLLLRLKIHDVTSGYRAYHRDILKQIKLDEVDAGGYAFQIEMVYLTEKLLKAKVGEVPIVFVDRKIGKSKLGFKDILEFWLQVMKLWLFGWRRKSKLQSIN
ncbi:MAG: polyprenol monophosphomannose synthase [Candidatus Hodarchaeales archaeon]|jgi:dolichol-phosphate mannosyltransferase